MENEDIVYKVCEYCGKSYTHAKGNNYLHFLKKGKFCSHSCHISNNNKKRIWKDESRLKLSDHAKTYVGADNPNYKGGGTIFVCEECGITFSIPNGQLNADKHIGKYCSLDCYHKKRLRNRVPLSKAKVDKLFQSALIRHAKKDVAKSTSRWFKIVGYFGSDFRKHMELLFEDGMSWDNYGKWHIDHIKPSSYFLYNSEYDPLFKECWSLTNLQPLWAMDNLKKGGCNTYVNQLRHGNNK